LGLLDILGLNNKQYRLPTSVVW